MKRNKIIFIIAVLFVIVGALIFTGALAALGFDFRSLSTESFESNTYELTDAFDKISIDVDTSDVTFIPSKDEKSRVVFYERKKVKHTAEVNDGTLIITTVDNRKWYEHIGISFENMSVTVHLPQKEYTSLIVNTDTGDIETPKDFSFTTATAESDTGSIAWYATVKEVLKLNTDTGRIKANDITADELNLITATGEISLASAALKGVVNIQTDTGDILLSAVNCERLTAKSSTGSIYLKNTLAADRFSIESDTGNVNFERSDADSIYVQTDTGDVKGSLLSEKVFITETSTGRTNVPKTINGGRCEITTDTGDIDLSIN